MINTVGSHVNVRKVTVQSALKVDRSTMRIFFINISDIDKNNMYAYFGYFYEILLEKKNCRFFSNNIYNMMNNNFCSITLYKWYQINYLKYTNNIPAELFRYMLFCMKPNMMSTIISGIKNFPS